METVSLINIEGDIRMIQYCIESNNDLGLPISISDLNEHVESIKADYSVLLSLKEKISYLHDWAERFDRDNNGGINRRELDNMLKSTVFLMQKMETIDTAYVTPERRTVKKPEYTGIIKPSDLNDAQEFTMHN